MANMKMPREYKRPKPQGLGSISLEEYKKRQPKDTELDKEQQGLGDISFEEYRERSFEETELGQILQEHFSVEPETPYVIPMEEAGLYGFELDEGYESIQVELDEEGKYKFYQLPGEELKKKYEEEKALYEEALKEYEQWVAALQAEGWNVDEEGFIITPTGERYDPETEKEKTKEILKEFEAQTLPTLPEYLQAAWQFNYDEEGEIQSHAVESFFSLYNDWQSQQVTDFETETLPYLPKYLQDMWQNVVFENFDPTMRIYGLVSIDDFNKEYERWATRQTAQWNEIYDAFSAVYEGADEAYIAELISKLGVDDATDEAFLNDMREIGRTDETEQLLRVLNPGITDEDMARIFGEEEEILTTTEKSLLDINNLWKNLTEGEFSWGELGGLLMGGLNVMGAYMDTYIGRPWYGVLMESSARLVNAIGIGDQYTKQVVDTIDRVRNEYGWAGVFSEEVANLWEQSKYWAESIPVARHMMTALEWLNPVYFIPIGGAIGYGVKAFTKIPLLGRSLQTTAAAVNALEKATKVAPKLTPLGKALDKVIKGITFVEYLPGKLLTWPFKKGAQGVAKVAGSLGEDMTKKIIGTTDHLLINLPKEGEIATHILVDNWQKSVLLLASKIPLVKTGINKTLGWRILVRRNSKAVEDVVGRAAVEYGAMIRMGVSAAEPIVWELKNISSQPVKMFGFNKNGFSQRMADRALPKWKGKKNTGTLEDVFSHPERYNLERVGKKIFDPVSNKYVWAGEAYIKKFRQLQDAILALLKSEGVEPANLLDDWVHRIVEQTNRMKIRRSPRTTKAIGTRPSYEKPRRFKTFAEGMEWFATHPEYGLRYVNNPEILIGSYIQEAFKKIADARLLRAIDPFGITPSEKALQKFPNLFIRNKQGIIEYAPLVKATIEAKNIGRISSAINRMIRGEKLPAATMKAIERYDANIGKMLKALGDVPVSTEKQLYNIIKRNERTIATLQEKIKKLEAIDVDSLKAQIRQEIARNPMPADDKLREAFKVMNPDDRIAYRRTMDTQLDDIHRMVYEQSEELVMLTEYFNSNPASKFIDVLPKTGAMKGQIETLTFNQYRLLTGARWTVQKSVKDGVPYTRKVLVGGRKPPKQALTKDGKRIRWEYALDDIATEQGFKSGEAFKNAIEDALKLKQRINDLKLINKMGNDRVGEIKKMLRLLDEADVSPDSVMPRTKIPQADPGMPEAGVTKDIFGYEAPYFPKTTGKITQMSMDEYNQLIQLWEKAGLPKDSVPAAIRPKIEGIKGLEGDTAIARIQYETPAFLSEKQRIAKLKELRAEVKAMAQAKKTTYYIAKAEKQRILEPLKMPATGEAFLPQPFASGKIYTTEFIDTFNKFFGHDPGIGVLRVTSDVAGILRMTKAVLDFSSNAVQGLLCWGLAHTYLLTNPEIGTKMMGAWYKALYYNVRSMFDPDTAYKMLSKNRSVQMERIAHFGSTQGSDYARIEAQTMMAQKLMEMQPYKRGAFNFAVTTEYLRDEFWKILSPKAKRLGKEYELARLLDRITGVTDATAMGVPLTVRQVEQTFLWFAPNYTRACLTVLADIFRGGYTGAEVRKAIGGLIGAGSIAYSGIQYSIAALKGKSHEECWEDVLAGFGVVTDPITNEVDWEPSGKMMSVEVDNMNIGIGGFWYGLVRLAGNIMATVEEVGDRERIDLVRIMKHGSLNKQDNPFIQWWYSRSSPFFSTAFELSTGKDYLGYPLETWEEYAMYIAKRFEPIWMENGINWLVPGLARDQEIPEGLARAIVPIAAAFGLRTFPESAWVDFYDLANEYIKRIPEEQLEENQLNAWREGKLEWKHLTGFQKSDLLTGYPDLFELYQIAQADSAMRNNPVWQAWQGRMQEERDVYYGFIDELCRQLMNGEITTREFREKAAERGSNYGYIISSFARDEHYSEIYNFFENKEGAGDKYGFMDDIMLADYMASIMHNEELYKPNGDFDFDARDKKLDEFIDKWGMDGYERVLKYLNQERFLDGLNPLWIRRGEDTEKLGREYWKLPYKPIIDMEYQDYIDGNIPVEYVNLWLKYQEIEDEEERNEFLENNPDLTRDFRAEWRATHPEDDARLALWGYGGELQSLEAYNLVEQWSKELGIPLEAMGDTGLPSGSLVPTYFEYFELQRQYGASSSEVKLFRLENPRWEEWGEEHRGWSPITDNIEVLKINRDYREHDIAYESIPSDDMEAREAYLKANEDYRIARRTREAYQRDIPIEYIQVYVDYYEQPSYDHKQLFLKENPDFAELINVTVSERPLESLKLEVKWHDNKVEFNELDRQGRMEYLQNNPEYAKARRMIEAYDMGLPEHLHDAYINWYVDDKLEKPDDWKERTGTDEFYERDWFLMENPEFYKAMVDAGIWEEKSFDKVPTREVFDLYLQYKKLKTTKEKDNFRWNHRDLDEWMLLTGKVSISIEEKERRAGETPQEKFERQLREAEEEIAYEGELPWDRID